MNYLLFNRISLAGVFGVRIFKFGFTLSNWTGRTQIAKANYVFRVIGEQIFGVFQVSVLSRVFSLMCTTTYCIVTFKDSFVAFAYDTSIFYT